MSYSHMKDGAGPYQRQTYEFIHIMYVYIICIYIYVYIYICVYIYRWREREREREREVVSGLLLDCLVITTPYLIPSKKKGPILGGA